MRRHCTGRRRVLTTLRRLWRLLMIVLGREPLASTESSEGSNLAANAGGWFYTWWGHKNTAGFFGPLIRMGTNGSLVQNFDSTAYDLPLVSITNGNVLTKAASGTANVIELSTTDGSLVGTRITTFTDLSGEPWIGSATFKTMRIDASERVYQFFTAGVYLFVARWNADYTYDQSWQLEFSLNTTGGGSKDSPPSGLHLGCDISPDGRYVYSASQRDDSSTDRANSSYTSSVSVYKFDLDESATPTPTIFCQYPYQVRHGLTDPPHTPVVGTYYNFNTPFLYGLSVSPDGSKVAVEQVTNAPTSPIRPDPLSTIVSYDQLSYNVDLRSSAGSPLATYHLRSSAYTLTGGNPYTPVYQYCWFRDDSPSGAPGVIEWAGPNEAYCWLLVTEVGGEIYTNLYRFDALTKDDVWNNRNEVETVTVANEWTPYMTFGVPFVVGGVRRRGGFPAFLS